jgi:hypothetical protein
VAGFEELRGPAGCVGGQELLAPPIDLFEQSQLCAGVGFLAAGDDAQVLGSVRQLVTVWSFPEQGGELDHCGLSQVSGCTFGVEHVVPAVLGCAAEGGAFSCAQLPSGGVLHCSPGRGVEVGDVVDEAVGGAGTVQGDQQVAVIPGRDLDDGLLEHLDVVTDGVGPGAALAQLER